MGMFNWVTVPESVVCANCSAPLHDWQTKDCIQELYCETIPFSDTNEFYSNCEKCQTWNEYRRKRGIVTLEDFERIRPPSDGGSEHG